MDSELLTVAAVARRLGIAPSTLRTWDRRYGLGPTGHEIGAHRRYCPCDLAKLTMMRRLITAGIAPCEAAVKAKGFKGKVDLEELTKEFEVREELVNCLNRAAKGLDKEFIEVALKRDISANGVASTWSEVIVPLLKLVGNQWECDGSGVEVEHMLSEIIKRTLRDRSGEIKQPVNDQPVLLAAVGEELHCLALHALAAVLAEKSIETFFLGARTPLEAIAEMVKRTAPPAVFLWAQLTQNCDVSFFREIPAIRPAPRVIVGGPGWNQELCSSEVVVASTLTQACSEIERAVGL